MRLQGVVSNKRDVLFQVGVEKELLNLCMLTQVKIPKERGSLLQGCRYFLGQGQKFRVLFLPWPDQT